MTEPQVWTVIGVLAAALFGTITVVTSVLTHTITVQIGGLRAEMVARFDAVDARFETVNARLEALDRDVQSLTVRVFGTDH